MSGRERERERNRLFVCERESESDEARAKPLSFSDSTHSLSHTNNLSLTHSQALSHIKLALVSIIFELTEEKRTRQQGTQQIVGSKMQRFDSFNCVLLAFVFVLLALLALLAGEGRSRSYGGRHML